MTANGQQQTATLSAITTAVQDLQLRLEHEKDTSPAASLEVEQVIPLESLGDLLVEDGAVWMLASMDWNPSMASKLYITWFHSANQWLQSIAAAFIQWWKMIGSLGNDGIIRE